MTRVKAILGEDEVVALIRHVCEEAKLMVTMNAPSPQVATNIVDYGERIKELGELLYAATREELKPSTPD